MRFLISCFSLIAWAHHGTHILDKPLEDAPLRRITNTVSSNYIRDVKPIFERKCGDCHGSPTSYPGYYRIPLIKQWIDHDISEGHEHFDISNGFPFGGHGSITDNFKAIRDDIGEGRMPPWLYRLSHRNSGLNEEEKKIISKWVTDSQALFGLK